MFQGTIPPEMRSIVHEHARLWPDSGDVYVGCSGNLTIERTLARHGFTLHSNDVNPYSCALGWLYAGEKVLFQLRDEHRDQIGWIEQYLDDGAGTVATLMLGTSFLDFVGRDTPYHQRMVEAYRQQFPRMHEQTTQKLQQVTLRLGSFYAGDVREYLNSIPADAPVASFPPFWAAGYAQMFKGIEQHFAWPEPEFEEITDEAKTEIVETITDRPYWLLGLHFHHPDLEQHRVGYVRLSPRAMPIHVYANPGRTRWVGPNTPTAPVLMPKIRRHTDLGGDLTIHPLNAQQFAGLRAQFLDKKIPPGAPQVAAAVASGGQLIGAFGWLPPKFDPDCAYLMSDFSVGWSKYRRLSKLIVMAATSVETQTLLQRSMNRRLTSWATTAFTNNPTSGKYGRGVPGVQLHSRKKADDGEHTYQLQYGGQLGGWTLAEALSMWRDKHGGMLR